MSSDQQTTAAPSTQSVAVTRARAATTPSASASASASASGSGSGSGSAKASASATASASDSPTATARRSLDDAVSELLDGDGDAVHGAVAALDLDSGTTAASGATAHRFATASIVKVDILAALLLQAQDRGEQPTAAQLATARAMITQSDNDAAGDLYAAIGGADGLDAANRRLGLTATTAGADGYWGLTETTAADQLRLLRAVFTADGSPLDAASRGRIQQLMGAVEDDQAWGVSAAADSGTTSYLKNGWLPRTSTGLWVVNSIGEVTHDGHRVLVAVLGDGLASESAGIARARSLAEAAASAVTS
ncbi:hypothetical protein BIV57_22395 [Mangrovactinospora gilvigrisea]|uniref:Beta-lactamase class A catalytic domain-containing protein n=1 Tax=Mangrovactinospora gilvigrisea TaxID=1428644 RepID=A0A1J7C6M8_9ACTN|nr:hypothetical protein BIV57_22395 [Mangrovactinospora gilvigrisea]